MSGSQFFRLAVFPPAVRRIGPQKAIKQFAAFIKVKSIAAPLSQEKGVGVFRTGQPLSAATADKVLKDIREQRDSQNAATPEEGVPDYGRTESFLQKRGVPLNYSAADLEADNATPAKLPAHS